MNRPKLYKIAYGDPQIDRMISQGGAGAPLGDSLKQQEAIYTGDLRQINNHKGRREAINKKVSRGQITKDIGQAMISVDKQNTRVNAPGTPDKIIQIPVDQNGLAKTQINPTGPGYKTVYVLPDDARVDRQAKREFPYSHWRSGDQNIQRSFNIIQNALVNGLIAGADAGSQGIDWVYDHTLRKPGEPPLIGWKNFGRKRLFPDDYYMQLLYGGARGQLSNKGIDIPYLGYGTAFSLFAPTVGLGSAMNVARSFNPKVAYNILRGLNTLKKVVKPGAQTATIVSGITALPAIASTMTKNKSINQYAQSYSKGVQGLADYLFKPSKNDPNYWFNLQQIEEARKSVGNADWRKLLDGDWRKKALAQQQRLLNIANKQFNRYSGAYKDPKTGQVTFKNASKAFKADVLNHAIETAGQLGILSKQEIDVLKSPQTVLNAEQRKAAKDKLYAYLGAKVTVERNGKPVEITNNQLITGVVLAKAEAEIKQWVTAQLNQGSSQWHAKSAATPLYSTDTRSATLGSAANAISALSLSSLGFGGNKKPINHAYWKVSLPAAAGSQLAIGTAQALHRNAVYKEHNVPELKATMIRAKEALKEAELAFNNYSRSKKFVNTDKDEGYLYRKAVYDKAVKDYMVALKAYNAAQANAISQLSVSAPALNDLTNISLLATMPLYRFSKSPVGPLIQSNMLGQSYMNAPNYRLYKQPWNMYKARINFNTDGNTGYNAAARTVNRPTSLLQHLALGLGGSGGLLMDLLANIPLTKRREIQQRFSQGFGDARDNAAALIP